MTHSRYLLDTCVISDFVKGEHGTLTSLKDQQPADLAISAITHFELDYGLALNPARGKKISQIITTLTQSVLVLPFTEKTGKYAAQIRADLKNKGMPIGFYDVLIAGCALEHGLTLVTANTDEFSRVSGLALENWRATE